MLREIVSQSGEQQAVLVEGALDLLAALLRPSPAAAAQQIHSAMSAPVMALMMSADDAGILQSCTEYIRCAAPTPSMPRSKWLHGRGVR